MATRRVTPAEALIEQAQVVREWLAELSVEEFDRPSVLPDWEIRTLTGHLLLVVDGFRRLLETPTRERPVPMHEWVRRYRRDVDQINASTRDRTGDHSGDVLVGRLASAIGGLAERLSAAPLPKTLQTPRGPAALSDFLATRTVELVVHADDLSRSLPQRTAIELKRPALSNCCRTLATILADAHPGRSIEVRVPPFAAVQCGLGDPGPTHTRGTPPNVIETDPLTFVRLATGRQAWAEARAAGLVSASGLRADLSGALPLLS
ncbi:maleylpyruvate isomerase family mycothiol-dependent enzyme [Microlunatus panaciterrae]|uniref:Uncharacterized protein (TIGR03083 family) n=1 Tax=Microlunatus panaciterrae TaxID=400768 RepID=A0ABS2RFW3_9ACTN|nr:maleylpyruvate isomerase family mycothiol-dependent enzyme [Microlunatus panaciterrae]MBM7797886.1 uncharacterized protein (TIGR03083 family) [Microlunatus panaciterrae]